jgi:hypothetical protein
MFWGDKNEGMHVFKCKSNWSTAQSKKTSLPKCTVTSNVVVHCLGPTRIDHRDEMIDEQLGHDGLIGLGRSLGQGRVRRVQLGRPGVQAGPGGVQRRRGVRLPPRKF